MTANDRKDTGSNVHRLVRNTDDDVAVLATDHIENDVATFRDSPIARVKVVSFAACDWVLCF